MDLRYDSIAALIEAAKQSGRKLSELVLEQQAVQMEQSADELYEIMRKSYAVMAAIRWRHWHAAAWAHWI